MITDNLTDDADIQREIRNLFVRTYTTSPISQCSMAVKCKLFKACCICLYHDAALWNIYNRITK